MAEKDAMLTAKHAAHPGLDVDKQLHWTYAVDSAGAVLLSRRVANTEAGLDSAIAECPKDTLVVVDQRRSIGALAFRRVRAAERPVARLPGSAEHEPAKDFPGIAKTDERDAADLAPGASGRPRARRRADNVDSGRLGAEGPHGMRERAAFQAAVVLPRVRARLRDGRAVVRRHALRARRALEHARHRPREVLRRLARAAAASGARADESRRSTPWPPKCTTPSASLCASSPTTKKKGGGEPQKAIVESLSGNADFANLQTIPGIGPRMAAQLVASVDVSQFDSHDKLASYCGLTPSTQRSGISIDYDKGHRGRNKPLKNLLVLSCNSLIRSKGYYGEYFRKCLARSMKHRCALKATARKRMKAIYAVMRDDTPYSA